MKSLIAMTVAAAAIATTPLAAQPGRARQVQLPPLPGFVPASTQRVGNQQMVEFVPRGQTVQRYTKMVTMTSFPVRPGTTTGALLRAFVQRYTAGCPAARVQAMNLGGGNEGARIDCARHPRTGKPETNFVRVVDVRPAVAIVSYMTAYAPSPTEAYVARDFLGRVAVR